jgi:hypothetical protein
VGETDPAYVLLNRGAQEAEEKLVRPEPQAKVFFVFPKRSGAAKTSFRRIVVRIGKYLFRVWVCFVVIAFGCGWVFRG